MCRNRKEAVRVFSATDRDYIKAQRRASREEEICEHGRSVRFRPVRSEPAGAYRRRPKHVRSFEDV